MLNSSSCLDDYNQKSLHEKPSLEIHVKNLEGTDVSHVQRNGSSSINITESIVSSVCKERFATFSHVYLKIFPVKIILLERLMIVFPYYINWEQLDF